ncbi:hypothetical protein TSOC_010025 [Tetrabaena socialis]|uniref:BZIP domain-containing protein n=1 Tax=Tetrabaena socialis TaxID=47790 RepID=A0A2J7ZUE6_9CHLO|nr:hypothetical protein TSOC_010025 [Tetrabaena socialis]|eukprot:PNH03869.1 hypothetical protein TSOC_010025 [Tetrabaena socialis]
MADLGRFDSATLFSVFKNENGGENLLNFDDLEDLLDIDLPLATAGPVGPSFPPASASVLPSTSGAGESEHTRAGLQGSGGGWGSNPSSDGGDSDGSDGDANPKQDGGDPSSTRSGRSGRSGKAGKASAAGISKRRQRNADQMESNRVAQQKYRQRKKAEQSTLQHAVDLLTAQVAALKAVEVRASELEGVVQQQGATINALQQHSMRQAVELDTTRTALGSSQGQLVAQHKLILDQQAKLRLQEQVIVSLKDRLKEKIDEALEHVVPGTVCEKMVAAVKATLYGAKDVHGLQDILGQLPEHLVHEICRNIFQVCKESWPELRIRCSQQVGSGCVTGAV